MRTQDRFLEALESAVERRGMVLVIDSEWSNTGVVSAMRPDALAAAGARLPYDFQTGHLRFGGLVDPVVSVWYDRPIEPGAAPFVCTIDEALDRVVDAIAPAAAS